MYLRLTSGNWEESLMVACKKLHSIIIGEFERKIFFVSFGHISEI